jgi:hypothetical protein
VDAEPTLRQREVFVAIVINDVPLDALVTEFGFNRMNDWQALDRFRQTGPRDVGYAQAMEMLYVYADLVAEGTEAEERYLGTAAHLRACGPCSKDFEALLVAVRGTTP